MTYKDSVDLLEEAIPEVLVAAHRPSDGGPFVQCQPDETTLIGGQRWRVLGENERMLCCGRIMRVGKRISDGHVWHTRKIPKVAQFAEVQRKAIEVQRAESYENDTRALMFFLVASFAVAMAVLIGTTNKRGRPDDPPPQKAPALPIIRNHPDSSTFPRSSTQWRGQEGPRGAP